jgi:DNA topoisomerase-2
VKNTTTVEITEIPPGQTYEKYETHLNSLIEKNLLVSYEDNSSGQVNYTLKFSRQILGDLMTREKLEDVLKMQERESENLTVLDEFGKLKIFEKAEDIVRYFVDFRLVYYQKRKDYLIDQLQKELKILNNRARFIKGIIDGKIKVNKVEKQKIIESLKEQKFDEIDGSYSYLLNMPIYSLTLERYQELLKQVEAKKAELEQIKAADIKDLYKKDLNELKTKLQNER